MLVDDESALRSVLARALRREGYSIVDAGDGVEAINILTSAGPPVHLLITDLDMPQLGGFGLAAHLRAANRIKRVIFMTGGVAALPPDAAQDSLLLRKPFKLNVLAAAVRQMLSDCRL